MQKKDKPSEVIRWVKENDEPLRTKGKNELSFCARRTSESPINEKTVAFAADTKRLDDYLSRTERKNGEVETAIKINDLVHFYSN